ncbi:MAG TPA: hypothetical protein VFV32_07335 [Acidimicrobiales bacterium]|nr:hypothetical protein [Acidimicrobiales bacterium]
MRRLALVALLALSTVGCTSDQAPEIVPAGGSTTTPTTSRTLAPCPAGGPDATTPAAGCIGEDGSVQRP